MAISAERLVLLLWALLQFGAPPFQDNNLNAYDGAIAGEGKVVVYSITSRIYLIEKLFEQRFPSIDMIAFVLSSREQAARLRAERAAGAHHADVLYLNDAPLAFELAREEKLLENYFPQRLSNRIPEQFRMPLLSHRLSSKVLLYNEETYPNGAPLTNLWELTLPAWRGRVLMVDPASRSDYLDLLTMFTLKSDELKSAYIDFFGSPPILKEREKSVGEKFIRQLFANDLILVSNTERLNAAIGEKGRTTAPVGFGTYSDIRNNVQASWALQVANEVAPAPGIIYPVVLAVATDAPHPTNARKLVDFMLGDDAKNGGMAVAPFYQPGEYFTRTDIRDHPLALTRQQLFAWPVDSHAVYLKRQEMFDLVLELQ